jgi:hypothetical protein
MPAASPNQPNSVEPISMSTQPPKAHMGAPAHVPCLKCDLQMRIVLIMPSHSDTEGRTFQCDTCGHSETVTVKYA